MRSVCLFTASLDPSGVGVHMFTLAKQLHETFDVSFVCPATLRGEALLAEVRALGVGVFALVPDDDGLGSPGLRQWLHERKPDVFHCHAGIGWESLSSIHAARGAGISAIVRTEHLPYMLTNPEQREAHRLMSAQLDALICVSDGAAASFEAAGVPASVLRVVQNGIEVPPLPSPPNARIREGLGFSRDARLAVTVARFTQQKGHAVLLESLPRVLEVVPDVHLVWVGDGPLEGPLRELAATLGVADRVHLLGSRRDVPEILAAADVFVLPSHFEGLPLVVLEAMAAGLSVVATDVQGTREAVTEGVTGRLVPPANAEVLATALVEALTSPELTARWGRAGRERVETQFSASRMAQETASVYDEILARQRQMPPPRTPVNRSRPVLATGGLTSGSGGSMNRIRLGFVGAGSIARRHLDSLSAFDDAEVCAITDVEEAAARSAASRFGGRAYTNLDDMLKREQLDALYICVPPFAHGTPEHAAIAHGLPFFVEKPLGADLVVAEEIARSVERAGLATAVGYHWRYLDTVQRTATLLAENPARLAVGYWLDSTPPPAWWSKEALSGGQMIEQTTHIFDLMRLLMGEVKSVSGVANRTPREAFPESDVAESSVAVLQFESGAVATVASTCLLKWRHRVGLHMFCDGMAIELSEFDLMVDVGQGRPMEAPQGDPVQQEDRDFLDAVAGKANRIRVPYGEALKTHRLAVTAALSARVGKTLAVPTSPTAEFSESAIS